MVVKHQLYRVTAHKRDKRAITSSVTFHVSADDFAEAHEVAKQVAHKEDCTVVHVDHRGKVYTGVQK